MAGTFAVPSGGHDLSTVYPHGRGTDGMVVSQGATAEGAASPDGGDIAATLPLDGVSPAGTSQ